MPCHGMTPTRYCIRQFGFIPNGMRTYYLSRSQPPFFSFMVEDAAVKYGDSILVHYLPDMVAEYQFWMKGADAISESHPCSLRVVRMPEGEILNRYYDNYNTPREEAWRNDVERQDLTGGGEYENQTGFGWTNGVYRAMEKDP